MAGGHRQGMTAGQRRDFPPAGEPANRQRLRVPHGTEDAGRYSIGTALGAPQASIDARYLYDSAGSALFERITRLAAYYPTRTERAIMATHGADICRRLGYGTTLIELGAGNCEKARQLCAMLRPARFVAIDISADFLNEAVADFRIACPEIDVRALIVDLHGAWQLPADIDLSRRVVFYPGSSIGNLDPGDAVVLLRRIAGLLGPDGALLIGVDLLKDKAILETAYNDPEGITAAFNLNVLAHINRLLGSDFVLRDWRHHAFFAARRSRIEMHLEARADLWVTWPGGERHFRRGEPIHTENSYKYRIDAFAGLLAAAGFSRQRYWTDARRWFAVFLVQG